MGTFTALSIASAVVGHLAGQSLGGVLAKKALFGFGDIIQKRIAERRKAAEQEAAHELSEWLGEHAEPTPKKKPVTARRTPSRPK